MKNNKSINIYMGIIGEAYVDKETAYAVLIEAQKGVENANAIIAAAEALATPLAEAQANALEAYTKAVNVYEKLQEAINNSEKNSIKYTKLVALLSKLNETDINGASNSGNIYTASQNQALLNSLEDEIADIKTKANELLEANLTNVEVRRNEYRITKEIFESMIPANLTNTPEEISNTVEQDLEDRIDDVQNNIDYSNIVSDEISTISDEVSNEIDNIGDDEGETPSGEPTEYSYWYAGNSNPLDIMINLGFTGSDTTWTHGGDFGIDGPLTANKWFHMPKTYDGKLIAGVDGGKNKEYWHVAVTAGLTPKLPIGDNSYTSDDNYESIGSMTINGTIYSIWRCPVTIYNRQRLNVLFINDNYVPVGPTGETEPVGPTGTTEPTGQPEPTNDYLTPTTT